MTRITFPNSRGLELVGRLNLASPRDAVLLAHGFTSDKSSDGRFDYIAHQLNARGFSTLAFDFSGCGESPDDRITLPKLADDIRCAAAHLRKLGFQNLAIWANSLGSRAAVEAAVDGLWTMVLMGAGLGPVAYDWAEHFSPEQLRQIEERGWMELPVFSDHRTSIAVDAELLAAMSRGDAEEHARRLARVTTPILIIHGDADEEERTLQALSRRSLPHLPAGSRIEVLPGAAHGFYGHIDALVALGGSWLEDRASENMST